MPRAIWSGSVSFGLVNVPEEAGRKQTRTIDIEDFVPLASIDPVHFQRSHWLTPNFLHTMLLADEVVDLMAALEQSLEQRPRRREPQRKTA